MKYKYLCHKSLLRFSSKPDLGPASAGAGGRGETRGLTLHHGIPAGPGTLHYGISPGLKSNGKHGPGAGPGTREVKCALDSVLRRWAGVSTHSTAASCLMIFGPSRNHARELRSYEALNKIGSISFLCLSSLRGRNVFCNFQSLHARATNQTRAARYS